MLVMFVLVFVAAGVLLVAMETFFSGPRLTSPPPSCLRTAQALPSRCDERWEPTLAEASC